MLGTFLGPLAPPPGVSPYGEPQLVPPSASSGSGRPRSPRCAGGFDSWTGIGAIVTGMERGRLRRGEERSRLAGEPADLKPVLMAVPTWRRSGP